MDNFLNVRSRQFDKTEYFELINIIRSHDPINGLLDFIEIKLFELKQSDKVISYLQKLL